MKRIIALALAVLVFLPAVLAFTYVKPEDRLPDRGVHRFNEFFYDPRVQDKSFDSWTYLTPVQPPTLARGYPPFYPRGTAWVQSVRSAYKPHGAVTVQVKELRPSYTDNTVYEAWLFDKDTDTMFSLGRFDTVGGGVGEMKFSGRYYFDAYDYVLITREPRDDPDPRPSDDEILIGQIVKREPYKPALFEPQPVFGRGGATAYGYTYYGE